MNTYGIPDIDFGGFSARLLDLPPITATLPEAFASDSESEHSERANSNEGKRQHSRVDQQPSPPLLNGHPVDVEPEQISATTEEGTLDAESVRSNFDSPKSVITPEKRHQEQCASETRFVGVPPDLTPRHRPPPPPPPPLPAPRRRRPPPPPPPSSKFQEIAVFPPERLQLSTAHLERDKAGPAAISPLSAVSGNGIDVRRSRSSASQVSYDQRDGYLSAISSSPPPSERAHVLPNLAVPEPNRQRRPSQASAKLSIRDQSRSRSGSVSAQKVQEVSREVCAQCGTIGAESSFCNVCKCSFCDKCWEVTPPHKIQNTRGAGEIPHEKTDQSIAKKVSDVLTPDLDEDARDRLHTEDINTTWFGVVREERFSAVRQEQEFPLFRDYGRYASLVTRIKDLRIDLIDSLIGTLDQNETLYPSLVSFVGQTGAGKSTLIKLLIDLKSEPHEKFPTPVVGAPKHDLSPTSEDVHLYLDPDSSMSPDSQAPLLFADCEGLDGGERDPIGARGLKRKLERASGTAHPRQQLRHTSERELIWADSDQRRSRDFAVAHLYPRLLYTFSDVIVFVLKNPRLVLTRL